MNECKCTMAQSLTGDGCRYCQPQEYINRLHEQLEENDKVIAEIIAQVAASKKEIPKSNKHGAKLFNAELSGPRPLAAEGSRSNDVLAGTPGGKD